MDEPAAPIAWLTLLFEGGVIAFALWELYKLRRDRRRGSARRASDETPPES